MRTRPDERFKRWARALRAPAFKAGAVSEALSRAGVAPVFNAGATGFSRDWPSTVAGPSAPPTSGRNQSSEFKPGKGALKSKGQAQDGPRLAVAMKSRHPARAAEGMTPPWPGGATARALYGSAAGSRVR